MDTAIERIFDRLKTGLSKDAKSVGELLDNVMVGLYRREFKVYPDQNSIRMQLLVAVKPEQESKVGTWSIDSSAVRRMKGIEIVGYGELVQFVADQLYTDGMPIKDAKVAMLQVLSAVKKRVQYVGGESYVHVLRDDGSCEVTNCRFSPEKEGLYEFFQTHGRELLSRSYRSASK